MAPGRPPHALVIAFDFPPHAAIGTMRTLRVVRALSEEGWQVTVLTGNPAHFLPGTPVDQGLLDRVPPSVRVLRAGSIRALSAMEARVAQVLRGSAKPRQAQRPAARAPSASEPPRAGASHRPALLRPLITVKDVVDAAFAIPDREAGWILPAIRQLMGRSLREHPPDVIYSSAPPWSGQLVALAAKRLLRKPWVADFRDPWSRAPWRGDRLPFTMRAAATLERRVVAAADRVLFVASGNFQDFSTHYGPAVASKFQVIPNGCDASEFDGLARTSTVAPDPFVLLHAGSLYAGRTPMHVLKALATAVRRGVVDPARFRLRFLGTVALTSSDLLAACRELGIESLVEFAPRVPRRDSLQAMMSASALLILQPGHTVSVPGKLYEYLAAGRPILAIAEEGEVSDVVRSSGIGVSVTPENEDAIVDALAQVMAMSAQPVVRPSKELYDGMARARQAVAVLNGMVS